MLLPERKAAIQRVGSSLHTSWFQHDVLPHELALRAYLRGRFPTLPDVDDLIQETYARLLRAREAGELKDARPYLFSTARHAAIDYFRRCRIVRFEPLVAYP
jgi:RNA polymerase sigma-70 factor (ECF subfamily)